MSTKAFELRQCVPRRSGDSTSCSGTQTACPRKRLNFARNYSKMISTSAWSKRPSTTTTAVGNVHAFSRSRVQWSRHSHVQLECNPSPAVARSGRHIVELASTLTRRTRSSAKKLRLSVTDAVIVEDDAVSVENIVVAEDDAVTAEDDEFTRPTKRWKSAGWFLLFILFFYVDSFSLCFFYLSIPMSCPSPSRKLKLSTN